MKSIFSKKHPQQRRDFLANQLAEAEAQARAAQDERLRCALSGDDTGPAEGAHLKAEARVATLHAALAQLDREIAQAELEQAEKLRRKQHSDAANIFATWLEDARRQRAEIDNFVRDIRPLTEFHDRSAVGFADGLLGASADHIAAPFAHSLDMVISTFERALISLKNGDEHADGLARRALANN